MELILLKSSTCLFAFIAFYKVFLERISNHKFKRFYLLSVVAISIGIPFITFIEYVEPQFVLGDFSYPISDLIETETLPVKEPINHLPTILWSLYGLGVLLFSARFIYNLTQIFLKIKRNPKRKTSNFISVLLQDLIIPHTFFSYIFLNKTKFENREIPNEVLLHEETHVKQKHSLDIIFIELLQIVFWFNPLVYILKRDIKLNHEFLADQAVINQGVNASKYQQILLAYSSHAQHPILAHAINYSLIKKRFTVMKTKSSKQSFWLRSLLLLPLLAGLLFSFSGRKQVEKEVTPIMQIGENNGVTVSLMEEYNAFMTTYKANSVINYSKHQRIVAIYNLMSEKQKASVEKYPELATPDLTKVKAKKPSKTQFEAWKNKDMFALWIDGKSVENSELNNYSTEDIVHYIGSKVYLNARSEKFPQLYQYHLYTKSGFNETYTKSNIKKDAEFGKIVSEVLKENTLKTNHSIPVLELKQNPLRLRLNGKETHLESLSKDFAKATNQKKSDLRINANGGINMKLIRSIQSILKDNLNEIKLTEGAHLIDDNTQWQIDKELFIMVQVNEITINGKPSSLKSFKKDLNAITKDWEETDYTSIKPRVYIASSSQDFLNALEKEFSKTHFSKANKGMKLIPPPPPAPKVVKGKISSIPPPPPPVPANASPEQKVKYEKMHEEYNKRYEAKHGEVSKRLPPPPPPAPANATPEQKKKYEAAVIQYHEKVEAREQAMEVREAKMISRKKERELAMKERELAIGRESKMVSRKKERELAMKERELAMKERKLAIERESKMVDRKKERELAMKERELAMKERKLTIERESKMVDRKKERELAMKERELAMKEHQLSRKKMADLPPPPPPPKSPLDHVIDMAKKDAIFYFDGKKITSDEAISLLKKDKELSISTQRSNSKKPLVNITTNPVITDNNGKVITKIETLNQVKSNTKKDRSGYVEINGKAHFYNIKNNKITYFNRWGKKVNEKGELIH